MKNCLIFLIIISDSYLTKKKYNLNQKLFQTPFQIDKIDYDWVNVKISIVSKNTADLISYLHILCVPSSMIVVTVETWKMKLCRYCQVKKNYRFIIPYVLQTLFLTSVCERCAGQFFSSVVENILYLLLSFKII